MKFRKSLGDALRGWFFTKISIPSILKKYGESLGDTLASCALVHAV
jgi:hypothetical protein